MAQSVIDNVSKTLDAGEIVSADPDFLKKREKELHKEVIASGFRMQYFHHLHNHFVEKLTETRAQREASEMDSFLQEE